MVDHTVVSKSSGGEKFLVLIVYDSFSGIINACPAFSQGSDFVPGNRVASYLKM